MKNWDPLLSTPEFAIESTPVMWLYIPYNATMRNIVPSWTDSVLFKSDHRNINRLWINDGQLFTLNRKYSPGPVCFNLKFSSGNLSPNIDSPPRPSPMVKSPPWIIKLGMILWNLLPLKWRGFPLVPIPFSPDIERKYYILEHLSCSLLHAYQHATNNMTTASFFCTSLPRWRSYSLIKLTKLEKRKICLDNHNPIIMIA